MPKKRYNAEDIIHKRCEAELIRPKNLPINWPGQPEYLGFPAA